MTILARLAAAVREARSEKRCHQVSLRVSPSLWAVLCALADRDGRSPSDYANRVLEQHAFGAVPSSMFADSTLEGTAYRASQRDAVGDAR
jgi:hypothetical protein